MTSVKWLTSIEAIREPFRGYQQADTYLYRSDADDPGVPTNADLVFVCDVLHHVPNRSQWLKRLYAEMPTGARLAIVEFKGSKLPEGPPESIKVPKTELIALLQTARFTLKEDRPRLLPYQEFLVFVKAEIRLGQRLDFAPPFPKSINHGVDEQLH